MSWDIFFFLLLLLLFASAWLTNSSLIVPSIPLAAFSIAVLIREQHNKKRQEFISQLKSHRKELRSGGTVNVDNMLLRYESPITSYHITVGTLFTTVTIPSHFRHYKKDETHAEALVYGLISILAGWWSINGPMATVHTLLQNLHGGETTTVAMLIDEPLLRNTEKVEKMSPKR
jgi:hypothetical protein